MASASTVSFSPPTRVAQRRQAVPRATTPVRLSPQRSSPSRTGSVPASRSTVAGRRRDIPDTAVVASRSAVANTVASPGRVRACSSAAGDRCHRLRLAGQNSRCNARHSSRPSAVAEQRRAARTVGGAVSGGSATATYLRACARCGSTPIPSIAEDLSLKSALVVDLRLCAAEAVQVICALLREAPGGIRQVVLRDGLASLGSDAAYRERADAHRRRTIKDDAALDSAPLRLLTGALASFLVARGARLDVLDLAGAPLGREVPTLLAPLAAALRTTRMRALQWLGLSGCRLSDRGLALLLPWLGGVDNTLPQLEALTIAWNGFADVRLVDALVRARARLCYERRAVPLRLLDLSGNPRLCDPIAPGVPTVAVPALASARRRGGSGVAPRLAPAAVGPTAILAQKGGALARSLACALAEGLPLRVLRLQRMRLNEEALQPLLGLLQTETRRCTSSHGALATSSGFCLEELDLAGNLLDPAFVQAASESLAMLQEFREQPLHSDQAQQHCTDNGRNSRQPSPQLHQKEWLQQWQEQHARADRTRAASEPPPNDARSSRSVSSVLGSDEGYEEAAPLREALSDIAEAESDEDDILATGVDPLRRVGRKRQFRREAEVIAGRRPRRRPGPGPLAAAARDAALDAGGEAVITIAGVLGPNAAQSLVRQALLEELRDAHGATKDRALKATHGGDVTTPTLPAAVHPTLERTTVSAASSAASYLRSTVASVGLGVWDDEEYNRHDDDEEEQRQDERLAAGAAEAATLTASVEADFFLQERLDSLRADVLGALASRADGAAAGTGAARAGAAAATERQLLDEMRWEVLRGEDPLQAPSGKPTTTAGSSSDRVFAAALGWDTLWHDWHEGGALGAAGG